MPPGLVEALAPANWPTLMLLTGRLGGLMLAAPLWSMTGMPKTARAGLVVMFAMMLLPGSPRAAAATDPLGLPLPFMTEMLIGLTIGLTAGVLLQGVSLAAELVSVQMGLSIGQVFLPAAELSVPGVGQLHGFLAMSVYLSLGGHLVLIEGLGASLRAVPPGGAIDMVKASGAVIGLVGMLFRSAVQVAAPVMVALLVANVAIALLSRAVPQLNAMVVSFPITIGLGFLMVGASLPSLVSALGGWVGGLGVTVDGMVRAFTPAGP